MKPTKFQKLVTNSFLFRLFMLRKLPMVYIAGIRVKELSAERSITTIRYKWLTQNPFNSMYFACQSMAAELSTGLLVMNGVYGSQPPVSMLVIKNASVYHKKAVGKITFTCNDGNHIAKMIEQAKQSTDGVMMELTSVGKDEKGEVVSESVFTWSLKAKVK
ncbi:MAG: thioesterase [Bacteroidetes bacterium]|nr:thioesterase [Bacteroidota bacterium]